MDVSCASNIANSINLSFYLRNFNIIDSIRRFWSELEQYRKFQFFFSYFNNDDPFIEETSLIITIFRITNLLNIFQNFKLFLISCFGLINMFGGV